MFLPILIVLALGVQHTNLGACEIQTLYLGHFLWLRSLCIRMQTRKIAGSDNDWALSSTLSAAIWSAVHLLKAFRTRSLMFICLKN